MFPPGLRLRAIPPAAWNMSERPPASAIEYDWYPGQIPGNVRLGENVYVDTSYGFARFLSQQDPGLVLGDATGAYDRATFIAGESGRIQVGAFTVLNGTNLICEEQISIGSHCLLAWGSVITDCWAPSGIAVEVRRRVLMEAA